LLIRNIDGDSRLDIFTIFEYLINNTLIIKSKLLLMLLTQEDYDEKKEFSRIEAGGCFTGSGVYFIYGADFMR